MSQPDSPEQSQSITEQLGQQLFGELPGGARSIIFVFSQIGQVSDAYADAEVADGIAHVRINRDLLATAKSLRAAMYRPGTGTWFSARFTVTARGSMDADFNYDDEPLWDDEIPADWFAADLERFPREDLAIPDWLRHKIAHSS